MSMMSMDAVFPAIGGIGILVTVMQPFVFSGMSGKSVGAAVPAPGATVGATVGVGQVLAAALGATTGAGGAALGDGAAAGVAHDAAKIVAKSTPDKWMERERVMATPHASLSRRARTIYGRAGERAVARPGPRRPFRRWSRTSPLPREARHMRRYTGRLRDSGLTGALSSVAS